MDPLTVVTGALGGVATHLFGWLKGRSDDRHEEKMARIRIQERAAEAKAKIEVAVQEAKGRAQQASWGAFRDSFKNDAKVVSSANRPAWADGLLSLVDVLRLSTRYLLIWAALASTVYFQVTGGDPGLVGDIAGIGVGWLFGERGMSRAVEKPALTPSMEAWGVDPAKLSQLEADQKG